MAKTFGITGTPNVTYDIDKMKDDSRLNSKTSLVVEIWNFNPNSEDKSKRSPNPPNLKDGQIWLSRKDETL